MWTACHNLKDNIMGGIVDSIWGAVDDVATLVTDTVKNVIEDPLPAIIAVGGMMVGIPPIYAGALAGGVGAAEHGGNILEGALVGGLSGAAGGAAAGWAGGAGAGEILAGAAGGAAAGATGSALTGGDIVTGALGGAAGGAIGAVVASYINPQTGNTTYTYDDGSTITQSPGGAVVTSTPSGEYGTGAPVSDLGTSAGQNNQGGMTNTGGPVAPGAPNRVVELASTGQSDSAAGTLYNGPNGQEIVLANGKTVLLSEYNNAIASGKPISVDGNMNTDYRVETTGIPRSIENPGTGTLPNGTSLASSNESQGAVWDDASGTYTNPDTGAYFSQEANAWVRPTALSELTPGSNTSAGGVPSSYVAPVVVNGDGTTSTRNYNGSVTTTYSNGTNITSNPDGTYVTRDSAGNISSGEAGGEASGGIATGGGGKTYMYDDGSSVTIHPDGTSTSTPAPKDLLPLESVNTVGQPVTNVDVTGGLTPPGTTPYNPDAYQPTPITPVFPVTRPSAPGVNDGYTPPGIGTATKPITNQGLNPGWITPTPFYDTTNDVQSQYYWGSHPFQSGNTFNAQQYNTVPAAPQQAWGQQGVMGQLTPAELAAMMQAPGTMGQQGIMPASGPIAPQSIVA